MDNFLDNLLAEVSDGEGSPDSPSASPGGGSEVEAAADPPLTPSKRSLPPAASLARRTIGRGRVRKSRLKTLTQKHKLMIGMHLNGVKTCDIAEAMGCGDATVTTVIRDPLAQEVIEHYYEGVEDELKALFPKVVDSVRDALGKNKDMNTRLKGVDRFTKLTGRGEKEQGERGVTVQVITDARTKFVQEIRAATVKSPVEVIDVEVEEVDV